MQQLVGLTSEAEVADAITDPTTAIAIARSLEHRRDPIGDVIAARVDVLVDAELALVVDASRDPYTANAMSANARAAGASCAASECSTSRGEVCSSAQAQVSTSLLGNGRAATRRVFVLETPDDLAAIGTRSADRGSLTGPTWQRYPTVGQLADALSARTYEPASTRRGFLCQIYIGH